MNLIADKDRLYDILRSSTSDRIPWSDTKHKLDNCEVVLDELCDVTRVATWSTDGYAYKGIDICRMIEDIIQPMTTMCVHYKTHQRINKMMMRVYKVSQAYHKMQQHHMSR